MFGEKKDDSVVYPFRKEDRKAIEKGFMYGLYDAVGKSGWYAFYKMKFGDEYDEKIGNGRHGEIGDDFDHGIDLIFFPHRAHFQKRETGVHGKHQNRAHE